VFRTEEVAGEEESDPSFLSLFACMDLKYTLLLCSLSVLGMLLLALSVEGMFHKLHHIAHKSHFWMGVLEAVEKELMILGMISFLLFMIEQGLTGKHIYHFTEIIEISHYTHLLLFFAMIFYYFFIVLVGLACNTHLQRLKKFELSTKRIGDWSKEYEEELKNSHQNNFLFKSFEWEKYHFYHMKHLFICSNKKRSGYLAEVKFSDFSYSDYIGFSTTQVFVKMIHVGWRIWLSLVFSLSACCLIFWLLLFQGKTFNDQLEHVFLAPKVPASKNNFLLHMLNYMSVSILILSGFVYHTTHTSSFLKKLADLAEEDHVETFVKKWRSKRLSIIAESKQLEKRRAKEEQIEAEIEMGTGRFGATGVTDGDNSDEEEFAFENTGRGVARTIDSSENVANRFKHESTGRKKKNGSYNGGDIESVSNNALALSDVGTNLGGEQPMDYGSEADNKSLVGDDEKKPWYHPVYRFSSRKPWDDPYTAIWFFKAPDLMIRVYQLNIFFFSFYASAFILNLRFANSLLWCLLPFFPLAVLFFVAYKMLPHYSAIRFLGTLTLDEGLKEDHRGKGATMWNN